jgi:hypothetical protein
LSIQVRESIEHEMAVFQKSLKIVRLIAMIDNVLVNPTFQAIHTRCFHSIPYLVLSFPLVLHLDRNSENM